MQNLKPPRMDFHGNNVNRRFIQSPKNEERKFEVTFNSTFISIRSVCIPKLISARLSCTIWGHIDIVRMRI